MVVRPFNDLTRPLKLRERLGEILVRISPNFTAFCTIGAQCRALSRKTGARSRCRNMGKCSEKTGPNRPISRLPGALKEGSKRRVLSSGQTDFTVTWRPQRGLKKATTYTARQKTWKCAEFCAVFEIDVATVGNAQKNWTQPTEIPNPQSPNPQVPNP